MNWKKWGNGDERLEMMVTGKKWGSEVRSDRGHFTWLCIRQWIQINTTTMLKERRTKLKTPGEEKIPVDGSHEEKN